MKKNILLLSLCGAMALTWTSCTDTVDYSAATAVEGQGVYFPTSVIKSYTVDGVSGSITLEVNRTYSDQAFDAALTATFTEGGESVFNVPSTVSFAAGSDSTSIVIPYNNLVRGTQYQITLSFADATPYANSSIDISVLYPSEVSYNWVTVSEEAVLTDQMFSMFSVSGLVITDLVVEKAEGYNMYRFASPYTNEYFNYIFGADVLSPDFETPYIVLDGETYEGKYYIAPTNLGFQMVNGEGPKADATWDTFGSVACNLSTADGPIGPDSSDYPLGSYDKTSQKFDFGAVYHNLGGYGFYIVEGFELYLDPALMEPDYERDYTWTEVEGSEGQFISELAGATVTKSLMVAEEDPTFYKFPSLYVEDYNLYFNIKEDGTVTIPSGQESGMDAFGNKVYMEGLPGKSSFDKENKILSLGVSLYLVDEEGNKTVELTSGVETFLWGKSEVDLLEGKASADGYVGTWTVSAYGDSEENVNVTITKADENTLIVRGLGLVNGYDDSIVLPYQKSTGLISFSKQEMNDFQGYQILSSLFDSKTMNLDMQGTDSFVGGFNSNDEIQFVNNPDNSYRWDSMVCAASDGSSLMFLSGYYTGLTWGAPQQEASVALSNYVSNNLIAPVDKAEFKPTLNKVSETFNTKKISWKLKTGGTQGLFSK